ncbi:unnamed protein product [Bathycoccus prasinos]
MSSTSTCQLKLKITYIELVGRGVASEVVLKDLQHLLVEAKQKVPEFLSFATEKLLEEDKELVALTGVRGCAYCGGLGHRIGACPKLDSLNAKVAFKKNSPFGSSECFGGEL